MQSPLLALQLSPPESIREVATELEPAGIKSVSFIPDGWEASEQNTK
jgi:hypothetical protein